jgi:hypothetical protein
MEEDSVIPGENLPRGQESGWARNGKGGAKMGRCVPLERWGPGTVHQCRIALGVAAHFY